MLWEWDSKVDSLNEIISVLKRFPGIGLKGARRIAFYLVKQDEEFLEDLAAKIVALKKGLFVCSECGNLSSTDPCSICSDPYRDRKTLCVVEDIEALSSFEVSEIYNGLYHVLGSRFNLPRGEEISEESLWFLQEHVKKLQPQEIIIATNPRVEGELAYFTLLEALQDTTDAVISRLAFGLPVGGNIEFADKLTLHTALDARRRVN